MIGALAIHLSIVGIAIALMQWSLRRRTDGGLFAALPAGLLVPLLMSAVFFLQVHAGGGPEMEKVRADWMLRWNQLLAANGPKDASPAFKAEFLALGEKFFGAMPAFYFCFQASVLAAIAVWLRRRQGNLGLASKAPPLSQWTAPLGMIWLVLGPVFWVYGGQKGMLHGPPWGTALAENLLVVGLALYVFQGIVILGAKLRGWSKSPGTRALAPLVMAALLMSLVLLNGQGLLVFLVLTGLFDPWIDLRRLQVKPEDGGAVS